MKRKRVIWTVGIMAVLALLAYTQFHSFAKISAEITKRNHGQPWLWGRDFFAVIAQCSVWRLAIALALIYAGYICRAWRWQVFLSRIKTVGIGPLIAPQFVGFTGLVLLGRPGEFIRPYLIARRTALAFSTQMAVLVLERIFDMGAFALIVALNLAFAPGLRGIPHYSAFRKGSYILLLIVVGLAAGAWLLYRGGVALAARIRRSSRGRFRRGAAAKLEMFSNGLHMLSGFEEVLKAGMISLLTWLLIAGCYLFTVRAFSEVSMSGMTLSQVLLLMFFSVAGGVIQLPGVGGGSQVATIAALNVVFHVPLGTAAAGGILIWLITSVSVIVPGLLLAHREHISLSTLSHEAEAESAPAG